MCCRPDGSSSAEAPIDAVLLDLDDTIYPQSAWLSGAWEDIARAASALGADGEALCRALHAEAAHGSDRGRIIDGALAAIGADDVPVGPLVDVFRRHRPGRLWPYPGAGEALQFLMSRVRVALVTDGDPAVQRGKLRALHLEHAFDAVVLSDELGRSFRKPHPAPLLRAAMALGVDRRACVVIGDRPAKDVAAAAAARMRAVRVRTGEYGRYPDVPRPWRAARDLTQAVRQILPFLRTPDVRRRPGDGDQGSAGPPLRSTASCPELAGVYGQARPASIAAARMVSAPVDAHSVCPATAMAHPATGQ